MCYNSVPKKWFRYSEITFGRHQNQVLALLEIPLEESKVRCTAFTASPPPTATGCSRGQIYEDVLGGLAVRFAKQFGVLRCMVARGSERMAERTSF